MAATSPNFLPQTLQTLWHDVLALLSGRFHLMALTIWLADWCGLLVWMVTLGIGAVWARRI